MTIEELGGEYLEQVQDLALRIEHKKIELKQALREGRMNDATDLRNIIIMLREMESECLDIGHHLSRYYTKGGKKCNRKKL